jgi:acetoin utilization deacetylase AcuC-like enzyme
MSKRLFYNDQYVIPLPEGHKFPRQKYGMLRSLLAQENLFDFQPAPLAEPSTLALAHDPAYVSHFVNGTLSAAAVRRIGFPWSETLVKRSLASAGGTLSAVTEALNTGWGMTLGGGTHHALRSEGAGFCAFNDIAVAIQTLRASGLIERAAVIDLDVHQGDGTAEIFQNDADVFTVSIHCRSNFPFRKQKSRIDVDLADKTADQEYLHWVDQVLPEIFSFEPDIIFYQSGVDALYSDSLGHLSLTHAGLEERDLRVMRAIHAHGIPFVLTMGGGYSKPIEPSVEAHANTYRMAVRVFAE